MKNVLKDGARTVTLWIGMMFGTALSGILIHPAPHPGRPDGPLPVLVAMLAVNAIGAVVVGGLASRLTAGGLRKALILLTVVFALETGFSAIESLVFGASLGLSPSTVATIAAAGLIRATATATFATLLWRRKADAIPVIAPSMARLAGSVTLYVLLYFAAGWLIAWQSEAVRAFYKNGADFDMAELLAIQVGRGVLWTGLVLLLESHLRGTTGTVASWVAAACALLMVAPLIYPNAIMPWSVREVHLVELAVANGLFGFLAVLVLRQPHHPLTHAGEGEPA